MHGTTVVTVVTLCVVKVLFAVNGQFVTDSGHFVIVSTTVEVNTKVVDSGNDVVTGLTKTLLLSKPKDVRMLELVKSVVGRLLGVGEVDVVVP